MMGSARSLPADATSPLSFLPPLMMMDFMVVSAVSLQACQLAGTFYFFRLRSLSRFPPDPSGPRSTRTGGPLDDLFECFRLSTPISMMSGQRSFRYFRRLQDYLLR